MNLSPRSLQGKLLGFAALLVIVPGVVLGVLADRSARDSLQRVIGRQLAREAGHTAERVASVLRAEQEALRSLARQDLMREIRVDDIDKRVSLALRTLRDGGESRLDYVVVDAAGAVVAASGPTRPGFDLPHWSGGLDLHAVAGGDGVSLRAHEAGLVLATGVPDPDRGPTPIGVLLALIGWGLLTDVTSSVERDLSAEGNDVSVVVVRPDGAVLGRSDAPDVFTAAPARWRGGDVGAGSGGYAVNAQAGTIVGSAPLGAALEGWSLWVVEPLGHALAPAARLTRRLAAIVGVALALALAVAALGSQRVVRPLSELTEAIRGVARGSRRDVSVPVRSVDEVGTLASAFNRMIGDLDRVQRNLVEAEKFAFVGELASRVAHEVRTSLGVVRSSAQLLEKSLPPGRDEARTELVQMMRAEVDRLSGVVDDLLTLDRPRELHLEPTVLSEPIGRAVDFVAPRATEKQVRLERSLPEHSPVVRCDPEAIQQVCVNLIVNALEEADSLVEVELAAAGPRHASIRIRDDGPGVPPDLAERIFEPFVTGRENGVGLGLSFVKRVVHEHGGEVHLESEPGRGACFRVELPVVEGDA